MQIDIQLLEIRESLVLFIFGVGYEEYGDEKYEKFKLCRSRIVVFFSLLEPFLSECDQYFGICDGVKFLVGISTSNLARVLIG